MTDHLMHPSSDGDVDEAVARVLAAERDAREALARAEAEAAQLAEDARAEQRALAERTRRRTLRVREAFARHVQAHLAEIARETRQLQRRDEPDADEVARLTDAVARLAAELSEPAR